MRFSYWWILLTVFTIESVMTIYHPITRSQVPSVSADVVMSNLLSVLFLIFSVQVFFLFGASNALGWKLAFADAVKYSGLTWTFFQVEDIVTFFPYLREMNLLIFWMAIPFLLWRIAAQAVGIRVVSGLSLPRSALICLAATLPWQLPLLYLNWTSI
jgi:hypothetical protein